VLFFSIIKYFFLNVNIQYIGYIGISPNKIIFTIFFDFEVGFSGANNYLRILKLLSIMLTVEFIYITEPSKFKPEFQRFP
jgi:hypothetical protein